MMIYYWFRHFMLYGWGMGRGGGGVLNGTVNERVISLFLSLMSLA